MELAHFSSLLFASKGDSLRMDKQQKKETPQKYQNAREFCSKFLTHEMLRDIVKAVCSEKVQKSFAEQFVSHVCKQVKKDSQDALQNSGLKWKDVVDLLALKAHSWFMAQLTELPSKDNSGHSSQKKKQKEVSKNKRKEIGESDIKPLAGKRLKSKQ